MNCEYVLQLLPLYVGHDLEEERSSLVAAHLQSCLLCVRAADEYARTSELLQRLEAPFFGDEVYAGIRRQVFNQIERRSHTPALSDVVRQWFAPLVQPSMRWVTAALILAISVTTFYFIGNRSSDLQHDNPIAKAIPIGSGNNPAPFPSSKAAASAFTGKKGIGSRQFLAKPKKQLIDVAQRDVLTSQTTARKERVAANERLFQSGVDLAQPSSDAAPLRVEIQTNDRNIRIIWLGSTRPQGGARETSKGI